MTIYSRLAVDSYFLQMAKLVSERSTCRRRKVGCVLVDSDKHVVATGYNGVPVNFEHCLDKPCEGANSPSGKNLDNCLAVHAEQNALLQLRSNDVITAYLTISPCITCAKMLSNSRVLKVVCTAKYIQNDALTILEKANIVVEVK